MTSDRIFYFLVVLIVLQAACAVFFVSDVLHDGFGQGSLIAFTPHLWIETVATMGLVFGIIFETKYLLEIMRHAALMRRNIKVATGALNDVIKDYFHEWELTPSESDVALFTIKGMTNGEIADLRNSSEGTIKAHLNAVFRKAGVTGRHQLVCLLVEDLLSEPLITPQ